MKPITCGGGLGGFLSASRLTDSFHFTAFSFPSLSTGNELAEREELVKLFRGCQAVGTEEEDALDQFRTLQKVQIEKLLQKVEIPAAGFGDSCRRFYHFNCMML